MDKRDLFILAGVTALTLGIGLAVAFLVRAAAKDIPQ